MHYKNNGIFKIDLFSEKKWCGLKYLLISLMSTLKEYSWMLKSASAFDMILMSCHEYLENTIHSERMRGTKGK